MDSISPNQRREASALLQIALHKHEFGTGHSVRLIDLSFIDEGRPDFAISGQYNFQIFNLADPEILQFRLEPAIRRLNSRCMGLLECHYGLTQESGQILEPSIYPDIFQDPDLLRPFELTVHFLHRSCRDFLLNPKIQSLLFQYAQGPYDPGMFLMNTRLSQCVALEAANVDKHLITTIASYVLSALSLPTYKNTSTCKIAAATIQPILEMIIQNHTLDMSGWYIDSPIANWNNEQSPFLTLAINFDLSSYVSTYLTPEYIRGKHGRPVLDYILWPRFAWVSDWICVGNRKPSLEVLEVALHLGANPNEIHASSTVWALFLCFMVDLFSRVTDDDTYLEYSGALEILIRAGASLFLSKSLLSQKPDYKCYYHYTRELDLIPQVLFSCRWRGVLPALERHQNSGSEPLYAISDLLEHLRSYLGSDVDKLKDLLSSRYHVDGR